MKKLILISMLTIFMLSCARVPLTGRKQFNAIPNAQLMTSAFSSYDQVMSESKLSSNANQVQMVRNVGNRVKNAVERYLKEKNLDDVTEGFNWEFNLIEETIVNAWCMPGGKVAFYTGILPVCLDEAGIAVVMGHEVAHAIAKHGGERMTQALTQQLGGMALSIALREQPEQTQALAMTAYTGGSTILGVLPFSRLHESEADQLGLSFMALAGYDPAEAPKFWQRMSELGGSAPPEFLSTHPSSDTRIKNLNKWMSDAKKYYNTSSKANNQAIPDLNSIKTAPSADDKSKNTIKLKMGN